MEHSAIDLRGASDLPLLAAIDGGDRGSEIFATAGFDLDETERVAVDSDDVDLACDSYAFRVPSDGNFEIGYDDLEAASDQMLGCDFLAAVSEGDLRRFDDG